MHHLRVCHALISITSANNGTKRWTKETVMDVDRHSAPSQASWARLPKVCFRLLRAEPLSLPITGGMTVGEKLLAGSAPLLQDVLEIYGLLAARSIKLDEYAKYVESSPHFPANYKCMRDIALELAKKHPAQTASAATKRIVPLLQVFHTLSRSIPALLQRDAMVGTFANVILQFALLYAELLYMGSAAIQILAQGKDETMVASTIRAAGIHSGKIVPSMFDSLPKLWHFIDEADGTLAQTLRAMATVAARTDIGPTDRLPYLRECALAGFTPQNCYVRLPGAAGPLQCVIAPLSAEESDKILAGIPHGICTMHFTVVPSEHGGFFPMRQLRSENVATTFILCGITGRLIVPFSYGVPLDLFIPEQAAAALYSLAREVSFEAFSGEFRIATKVPVQGEQPIPVLLEPAIIKERVGRAVHLPVDLKGATFIEAIRSMNRAFFVERGFSGAELEEKANPRLRQSGSHVTVYCAVTDRITPVSVHSSAMPIGTLRSALKLLRLEPAQFIKALG